MKAKSVRRRAAAKKRKAETSQNPELLLQALWEEIGAGRGKKALSRLQDAQKTNYVLPDFAALKFCAMAARVGELRRAGLKQESEQMAGRVKVSYPQVMAEIFPQSSVAAQRHIISWTSLDVVLKNIDVLGRVGLERAVADKVMTAPLAPQTTVRLTALEAPLWLTAERGSYMAAREHMANGAWDEAQEALSSISRSSAFSAWRLFCRSMAEFARGELVAARDVGVRLLRLCPDFVLSPVISAMHKDASDSLGKTDALVKVMYPQTILRQSCAKLRSLDLATQSGSFARELSELSHTLCPNNVAQAKKSILQALSGDAERKKSQTQALLSAANNHARSQTDPLFALEMALCLQPWSEHEWPAQQVKQYFLQLKASYKNDTATYDIVHAQAMTWLAERLFIESACEDCIVEEFSYPLSEAFVWMSEERGRFIPDLLTQALAADPQCREHYDAALKLLDRDDAYASDVTDVLQRGMRAFPKESSWCERLSKRYTQKGDIEQALLHARQALRRAPHDPSIEELVVATHLRWANHKLSARKFLATDKEFSNAEQTTQTHTHFGFQAARLLGLVQRKLLADAQVSAQLRNFSQDAQIRALGLMIAHLSPLRAQPWVKQATEWMTLNQKRLPAMGLAITEPLQGAESLAFAIPNPVFGLHKQWSTLLAHSSDTDLAEIAARVLAAGGAAAVDKEVRAREPAEDASARSKIAFVYNLARCSRKKGASGQAELMSILSSSITGDLLEQRLALLTRIAQEGELKISSFMRGCLDESKRRLHNLRETEDDDDYDDEDDDTVSDIQDEVGELTGQMKNLTDAQLGKKIAEHPEIEQVMAVALEQFTSTFEVEQMSAATFATFVRMLQAVPSVNGILRLARVFFEAKPDSQVAPALRRQMLHSTKASPAARGRNKAKPVDSSLPF